MEINLEKIKEEKSLKELLEFGILNIDKPSNYTSFQAAEIVGNMLAGLGVRKFSHFGTLDPLVTGVLPVALNRACKLTGWFMKKKKTYVGVMKIHKPIEERKLKEEMSNFLGKIMQLPPVKSRVKRQEREREVYSWNLLEFNKEKNEVLFDCEVEAGTYIRKLISDLGEKIGGAHMMELRRTKAGIFKEEDKEFINLYDLEKVAKEVLSQNQKEQSSLGPRKSGDFRGEPKESESEEKLRELIIPGEIICKILPVVFVKEEVVNKLLTGKPVFRGDLVEELKIKEENAAVFCNNRLIGIYKKVEEGDILMRAEWVLN